MEDKIKNENIEILENQIEKLGGNPYEGTTASYLRNLYQENKLYEFTCRAAKHRSELHNGQASQRKWTKNYESIGLMGELKFSVITGLDPDLSDRPGGDHYDFMSIAGPIDIKTRSKIQGLPVERRKIKQNMIYVLGKFSFRDVVFKGWAYGYAIQKSKLRYFFDTPTYIKPMSQLRSMESLYELIGAEDWFQYV